MEVIWAVVLVLILLAFWIANLVGLPGNWLMLVAVVVYWSFVPMHVRLHFHWGVLVVLAVAALAGEVVEFAASAMGASKAGGSKRSAALALAGSLVGAIAGLFIGLPIPVLGQIAGALLLGGLGAMGGAMLGEHWKGRTPEEGLKVGQAAFWGRLWGTLGKLACGGVMLVVVLIALAV